MLPRPPRPTLFPYTTLFRSEVARVRLHRLQRTSHERRDRQPIAASGVQVHHRCRKAVARREPLVLGRENAMEGGNLFAARSEEHTSELQSHVNLVCRLLLEK